MGGYTSFQDKWRSNRTWLLPVKGDSSKASCQCCNKMFSIKNGGESAVKTHEGGASHQKVYKEWKNNKQIVKGSSNTVEVVAPCREFADQVLSAEIIEDLNKIDKNQSFKSADEDNEKFSRMFPDSEIAKNYQQGKTKVKYMVQFGIAPYVKEQLMADMSQEQYCFHFDETTTSQVKKQYDGYITYYSARYKQVICSYVGSLFVGHCPASALLDHFFEFITNLKLDLDNLLNLGMDGPSVNKKFSRELKEELEKDHRTSFIDTGSCTLHTVHNSFGKGMNALKEVIDLDQFVIDLHFFFKKSSARREDFVAVAAVTDVMVHYLLKHCESRWLGIEKVLVRVIEQLPNITQYFLKDLPKKPEFRGEKGVGKTKRYVRIAECLRNPSLQALMAFVVFIGQDYKKYIVPLQTNAPMIHVLHSMEVKLVHGLMSKFIQAQFIQDDTTHKTFKASELMKIDVTDKKLHLAKVQVGAKATQTLKNNFYLV